MSLREAWKQFDHHNVYGGEWSEKIAEWWITTLTEKIEAKRMKWPQPTPDTICIADGYNQALSDIKDMLTK